MRAEPAALFIALLALGGCGGGGGAAVTPNGGAASTSSPKTSPSPTAQSSASPGAGPTATPTLTPASTPTPTPNVTSTPSPTSTPSLAPVVFTGGTQTVTFTPTGGTFTVSPADDTYSGTSVFGSNNASGGFNFTLSWASYSQITGQFSPGPLPSTIGTALLYFDFNSSISVSYSQAPAVTANTTGSFPGTKCGWAIYGQYGFESAPQWNSMTAFGISEVTPSNGSFTVFASSLPYGQTANFAANTDQYIATYCH